MRHTGRCNFPASAIINSESEFYEYPYYLLTKFRSFLYVGLITNPEDYSVGKQYKPRVKRKRAKRRLKRKKRELREKLGK